MVLNNKAQMFSVWFPQDFFYPEVIEQWTPMVQRMKLPYATVTDFMNSQIQKISYPAITIPTTMQGQGQFEIMYTGGKELEPILTKDFTITFKLTESYLTYWIMYDQIRWFLEYEKTFRSKTKVFMEDIYLTFLSDAGLSLVDYRFSKIVPTSIGSFELSYASQIAQHTTFDLGLHYNRMEIDFIN